MGVPIENLTPLGYLLVSASEATIYRTTMRYYGVEREPRFCPTEPKIREFFGEPAEEDPVVARAIDEWWELSENRPWTPITPDYDQAVRLLRVLGSRAPLDLVFCEIAWSPGEEARASAFRKFEGEPKDVTLPYGYDVAWPECTYSAVRHITYLPNSERWEINSWGLLKTYSDAREVRSLAESLNPHETFEIFRVHRVEPG